MQKLGRHRAVVPVGDTLQELGPFRLKLNMFSLVTKTTITVLSYLFPRTIANYYYHGQYFTGFYL